MLKRIFRCSRKSRRMSAHESTRNTQAIGRMTRRFIENLQNRDTNTANVNQVVSEHVLDLFPQAFRVNYYRLQGLTILHRTHASGPVYPNNLIDQSSILFEVIRSRQGLVVHNVSELYQYRDMEELHAKLGVESTIIIPVSIDTLVVGVITVSSRHLAAFNSEDMFWAQFAATLVSLYESHHRMEQRLTDKTSLLKRIMPAAVADVLEHKLAPGHNVAGPIYARNHKCVTVVFADIVGFTSMCDQRDPIEVMQMLHVLFCKFDKVCRDLLVYKVETIGDSYMIAVGLEEHQANDTHHAGCALQAAAMVCRLAAETMSPLGTNLSLRVGIHTGSAYAGVIGFDRPRYCLFGDTINTASRMESTGRPNHVQISETTYRALPAAAQKMSWSIHRVTPKGKPPMQTYMLPFLAIDMRACLEEPTGSLDRHRMAYLAQTGGRKSCEF